MGTSKKEGDEWAASVMGGEMRNGWRKETRPNQPDVRLPHMKAVRARKKSREWYDNYDEIFRRK